MIALFATCTATHYTPRAVAAVAAVLKHLGQTVDYPAGQTCCGRPFWTDNQLGHAADAARRFVDIFEPYDYIVTPGPGCCGMVRDHYPDLLMHDESFEPSMWTVAGRTYEFVEFLDRVLHFDPGPLALPTPRSVVYFPACIMRSVDGDGPTLKRLRSIINLTTAEASPGCCGSGGAFSSRFPTLARQIADQCATALGPAETVVCNEPACGLTLTQACRRARQMTDYLHPAELIAAALDL